MSYLSPILTLLVNAVKKATVSLDRDFNEIEKSTLEAFEIIYNEIINNKRKV